MKVLETLNHKKECISFLLDNLHNESKEDVVLIICAHATGFCKEMYIAFIEIAKHSLPQHKLAFVSLDFVNHGSSHKTNEPFNWNDRAYDILHVLKAAKATQFKAVIGIGHSMGASALFRAAQIDPKIFHHLILFEPVLFPPNYTTRNSKLAQLAAKRRNDFQSRQQALDYYSTRPFFKSWHPQVLFDYCQGAFHSSISDSGEFTVRLECTPLTESQMYNTANNFLHNDVSNMVSLNVLVGEFSGHLDAISAHIPEVGEHGTMGFYRYMCAKTGASLSVEKGTHFMPCVEPDVFIPHLARVLQSMPRSNL